MCEANHLILNKDLLYVGAQFLLFAAYFMNFQFLELPALSWLSYPSLVVFGLGVLMIVWGIVSLNDNLTPLPTPKRSSDLISHGIYKYVRHPIYSGIVIAMLGYALFSGSGFRLVVTVLLLVVFYFKSNYEESMLLERYATYHSYKKCTGRFLPRMLKK